jgi:glycosyltransferase involved in cell wall biosynthesis
MSDKLIIVMPVYNEQDALPFVVKEWIEALRTLQTPFELYAIDDGSTDNTPRVLQSLVRDYPELRTFRKSNSGHGQTCIYGYQLAIKAHATHILQIDSDGQCDPIFFSKFWQVRSSHPVLFGYRVTRDDGFKRWLISRVVSFVTLLATKTWVKDANVPYRLVQAKTLELAIQNIPSDFNLANILVAVRLKQMAGIRWLPIHFRDRIAGTPSVKAGAFAKHGLRLFKQLSRSA